MTFYAFINLDYNWEIDTANNGKCTGHCESRQRRKNIKITLTSLLVLLFAFGTGAVAHAQDSEWETLNNEVLTLGQQGHYDRAVVVAIKALQLAEQAEGLDHPIVARSLNNLALQYCNQGQYAKAEPLYKRSLTIMEKARGADHPDVAVILNNLAALYDDKGQSAKAEPLYKRSLTIMEKARGADHPDVAVILNNLAALYRTQGQFSQAEPLYKRSLAISAKTLGPDHSDVAMILENMAILYRKTGRDKTAEALEKRAASIWNTPTNTTQAKGLILLNQDLIPGEDSISAPAPTTTTPTTVQAPASSVTTGNTVGAPAVMVGDSYTFEVENTSDSKRSYVLIREITAIEGNRMTVETTNAKSSRKRTTYFDRAWGYLGSESGVNDGVSFSPALKYFDFPLSVGKKWTSQSTETDKNTGHQRYHTIRGTVEKWEKVRVPAGEFEALKIVLKTEVKNDNKISSGTDVSWYVPALRRSVKSELSGLNTSSGRMEKKIIRLLSNHIQ